MCGYSDAIHLTISSNLKGHVTEIIAVSDKERWKIIQEKKSVTYAKKNSIKN